MFSSQCEWSLLNKSVAPPTPEEGLEAHWIGWLRKIMCMSVMIASCLILDQRWLLSLWPCHTLVTTHVWPKFLEPPAASLWCYVWLLTTEDQSTGQPTHKPLPLTLMMMLLSTVSQQVSFFFWFRVGKTVLKTKQGICNEPVWLLWS